MEIEKKYVKSNFSHKKIVLKEGQNIKFNNGLALVHGVPEGVIFTSYGRQVYGVINEDFQEAEFGDIDYKTRCYLGFDYNNQNAIRIGENDFIFEYVTDHHYNHCQYRHIRLINGIPTLVKRLPDTSMNDARPFVVTGHKLFSGGIYQVFGEQVYDVSNLKHVTRKYSYLEAIPSDNSTPQEFYVSQEVKAYGDSGLTDRLHFKINTADQIISSVASELMQDWYFVANGLPINFEELVAKRAEELRVIAERNTSVISTLKRVTHNK